MAQLGLQKVLVMRGYDIVTDAPKITLKFLKESTFTNGIESTPMTSNGTPITHFDHSQSCSIAGNSAVIDEGLLSLQVGKDLEVLTNTKEIRISETVTVAVADTAATTYTATGTVGGELKFIEVLDSNGGVTKTLTQMTGTVATGKFTYAFASKALAFYAGEAPIGTKLRLHYYPTAASARKIQNLANKSSATLRWECEAVFKDACTSAEVLGLINIPKGHMMGNFEWALTEAGTPAIHNFSITAEKTCLTEELWTIYTYNASSLT